MTPSFGDKVRIKVTKETEAIGVGGFVGQVYGQTTPSSSGVQVIGATENDYAINVHFESIGKGYWFAPELVKFIDHGEGTEVRLQGIDQRWVRTKDGRWREEAPAEKKWRRLDAAFLRFSSWFSLLAVIPFQTYVVLRKLRLLPDSTTPLWLDRQFEKPDVFLPLVAIGGCLTVRMLYHNKTSGLSFRHRILWLVPIMMGPIGALPYYLIHYRKTSDKEL